MIRITSSILVFALILGGAAEAQPRPNRLFISPAGEPFRPVAGGPAPMKVWFDQADTDHDGALSFAEFLADHKRFFDIADVDKNGVLAGVDTQVYEYRTLPEILAPEDPEKVYVKEQSGSDEAPATPQQKAAESRTGAGRYGLLNEPEPIRAGDIDIDFQVTPEEWAIAARRRFNKLDANKDGKITFDELIQR